MLVFSFCACLFLLRVVGGLGREGKSLSDLNSKTQTRVRGQKASDSRFREILVSLVKGHGRGNLIPGLRSTPARSCKSVQTNTKTLSDKVFSFVVLDKGGGGGRGGLPEPRTLVKGNYILIPFRNLVYI